MNSAEAFLLLKFIIFWMVSVRPARQREKRAYSRLFEGSKLVLSHVYLCLVAPNQLPSHLWVNSLPEAVLIVPEAFLVACFNKHFHQSFLRCTLLLLFN